jgi:TPR repeat protein
MRLPDPELSRAIVIGMSHFDDPSLPGLPGVLKGVSELSAILTDQGGTGLRRENCLVVSNESSLPIVGEHLEAFAAAAQDTLIVYYAGHGVLDVRGELHLALVGTKTNMLSWTAIPLSSIRQLMAESPARNRVLMLDCCFSGRAIGTMADMRSALAAQVDVAGAYTLTSAPPNSPSFAPAQADYTAFTGELIRILRFGAPAAPVLLTLGEIYRLLHGNLAARGLPLPQQRNTESAHRLALAPNQAKRGENRVDVAARYGPLWRDAHDGNPEAMYHLGRLLRQDGHELDAEAWLKEAARLDHSDAMVDLASIHEAAGRLDVAELWFRRAAEDGGDHAVLQVADFMERRGKLNSVKAYLRTSANLGNPQSMTRLAALLRRDGKVEDAQHWIRMANSLPMRSGHARETQIMVPDKDPATLIRNAQETSEPGLIVKFASMMEWRGMTNEAEFFYRKAADLDHGEAMFRLAILLEDLRRSEEAENWYRMASENGHAEAMYRLGVILDRRGATAGEEWLKRSVEAGNTEGMFALGIVLFRRGDHAAADELFERAATAGHAAAMNAIGHSLSDRDPERAKVWFERATRLGNIPAMNNLGLLLLNDDPEAARALFTRAAQHGNNVAIANLEQLRRGDAR